MITGVLAATIICGAGWLIGGDTEAFGFAFVVWLATVLMLALVWLTTPLGWWA